MLCFIFLTLLEVLASACSCARRHPPFCKLGPWQQSLPSFPPWSTCTCTGGWRGTAGRTVETSAWHRSSPSIGVRPRPSWNPKGGWRYGEKSNLVSILLRLNSYYLTLTAQALNRLPLSCEVWAALTVGQRLPYCGPTAFLPFKASAALPGPRRSQEHRAIAVAPPFLAHNSVTVINTSTDTVLSINNNIPVSPR